MSAVKVGSENKRQRLIAAILAPLALGAIFLIYQEIFGGSSTPPPTAPPVIRDASSPSNPIQTGGAPVLLPGREGAALPVAPVGQPQAMKVATTAQSLDPTLNMAAMLRTESLVYEGTGRNIFFAGAAPLAQPKPKLVEVKQQFPPRNLQPLGSSNIVVNNPGPPPINLVFFGTATAANGTRRAFLLQGDSVFLASVGDVVDRRYKVVSIAAESIQIEDLPNSNQQTLPRVVRN